MLDAVALLRSLEGSPLRTIAGRENRVLRLEGDTVIVQTSRSPAGQPVPISWVQAALDLIERKGEVEISVANVGYRSAFIGAVLLALPGATRVHGASPPRVRLSR